MSAIVKRLILVTDLSQQLKKQRDFLKWMGRRYSSSNPDQSAAFFTAAGLFEDLRQELLQGLFDVQGPTNSKELFTKVPGGVIPKPAGHRVLSREEILDAAEEIQLEDFRQEQASYTEERRKNAGLPGYTAAGNKKCGDAFCDYPAGHEGHHSDD